MKFLSSRKAAVIVSALIFVFLFVLNCLTPYHVDDFVYHFRFDNSEPLEHIADIIPSMAAHAQLFNGRLVVHSLVQLFELLPKPVFNIVNAGMFVLLILLMERFIFFGKTGSALHILLIFCAVFVLMPVFGEVCLWLDGSVNYLWAIVFNLLFIYPYFRLFNSGEKFTAPPSQACVHRLCFCLRRIAGDDVIRVVSFVRCFPAPDTLLCKAPRHLGVHCRRRFLLRRADFYGDAPGRD